MLFLVTVVTAMDGSGGEVRGVEEPDTVVTGASASAVAAPIGCMLAAAARG